MRVEKDFEEFIELLNAHNVKYLIIGGYAVSVYGIARATKDIDFLIQPTEENVDKMMNVLSDFGFANIGIRKEDFFSREIVHQLGYPPIRIDILTYLESVDFETAWARREIYRFGDQMANFISIDDLIANKKAVGRHRDLADVELLEKMKKM